MTDILDRIVDRRRHRVAGAAAVGVHLPSEATAARPLSSHQNRFLGAISARRGKAVIAEVKMGSPSLGSLEGRVDPIRQAEIYAENGAAALSVVVEPDFFFGSYELLSACKRASGLPAVAKDFVVHPIQLQWAKQAGADAVLLIASLYSREDLHRYAWSARRLDLAPLVEVHGLADLARLDGESWEMIGVNNRDLATFDVAIENSLALASTLPTGTLKVAESGIKTGADRRTLAGAGFDAFLIGEALLLADDPAAKLGELIA